MVSISKAWLKTFFNLFKEELGIAEASAFDRVMKILLMPMSFGLKMSHASVKLRSPSRL